MKKNFVAVIFSYMLCALAGGAEPGPIFIPGYFVVGVDFINYSDLQKRSYAMGLIDGLGISTAMGSSTRWLYVCANEPVSMTDEQFVAIFSAYLKRNPGRWNEPMNLLGVDAMAEVCRKKGVFVPNSGLTALP